MPRKRILVLNSEDSAANNSPEVVALDLLRALCALVARYQHDGVPNDSKPVVDDAKRAIARATGRF